MDIGYGNNICCTYMRTYTKTYMLKFVKPSNMPSATSDVDLYSLVFHWMNKKLIAMTSEDRIKYIAESGWIQPNAKQCKLYNADMDNRMHKRQIDAPIIDIPVVAPVIIAPVIVNNIYTSVKEDVKTSQSINPTALISIINDTVVCSCKASIKISSLKKHILTKKHLERC